MGSVGSAPYQQVERRAVCWFGFLSFCIDCSRFCLLVTAL